MKGGAKEGSKNAEERIDMRAAICFVEHPFCENGLMYAVIETGGKQYRVSAGDTLQIERLPIAAGQPVTFDRVLLVSNEGKITAGAPTVAQAAVVADVVEHVRGEKKVAFKMKRRKGYHKKIGHRQELSVVRIKEINC